MRSIVVRLRRLGVVLHRRNVGSREWTDAQGKLRLVQYGATGQADLYGAQIGSGRHWEIEVKRPGNRPTEKQLAWLKEWTRLGAVAYWADSCNIAERVAEAIVRGGRVVWHSEGDAYDVEM